MMKIWIWLIAGALLATVITALCWPVSYEECVDRLSASECRALYDRGLP